MIAIKRAYDEPSDDDGIRVLVDRIWPRGVSKSRLHIDKWLRDVAPSNELRQFFGHDPARWREFRKRYVAELRRAEVAPMLSELLAMAKREALTLVYSAKDTEHNQAVVLKELLDRRLRI